jgi:hypothetical protein
MNYKATLIEHLKKEKLEQLNVELKAYETFTDEQLKTLLTAFKENWNAEHPKLYDNINLTKLKEFKEKICFLELEFICNAFERLNK